MIVVDHNRNREERKYLLSHKNLILLENPKAFDEEKIWLAKYYMKNFIHWLVEAKTELPVIKHDDRELIIGAYGAMKQFIPRISEFGQSDTLGDKSYDVLQQTNPYILVVWDNKRKVIARGSNNCAVCKSYDVKKGTCTSSGSPEPATQSFIFKYDFGGCSDLEFLPYFGMNDEANKKYEGLMYAIAKGYIFRYANGKVDPKPLAGPFNIKE